MADKQDYNRHNREYDEEQQKQHFQSWETFWGRPGYGAPREVLRPNNYDDDCEDSDDQKQNLATIAINFNLVEWISEWAQSVYR